MLLRMTMIVAVSAFVLNQNYVVNAAEKKDGFDALDDFEKDFKVAFGDAKSWSVKDGEFQCTGKPNGYICTTKSYSNYVLTLEFRYPEKPSNTGVLNYIAGEHKIWPACVEVQGHYSRLGQIFAMGGATGPKNNGDAEARKKATKPFDQWNKFEITSKDGVISAKLNDVFIGESGPYKVHEGPIGLQSEGAPVFFRNIRIKGQ
jgi:hypothetical protein